MNDIFKSVRQAGIFVFKTEQIKAKAVSSLITSQNEP